MTLSLWLDEAYAPRPPPQGRVEADVAIVGAGMTGASAAHALAGQGLRVVLLDADRAAGRASGRNAGFCITLLGTPYTELVAKRGRAVARDIIGMNVQNRDRVQQLVRELRIDCAFAATGSYSAAMSEAEAREQERSAALLRADGLAADWVADAEQVLGVRGMHGALFRPGDGQIHPARFVRGLVAHSEREGVRVHEGAPVRALERYGDGWALQGPGFLVEAGQALLCTNARAAELAPFFADKLRPVRAQMLATAPIPGLRQPPAPVYADHGYEYWRLHENRLLLGGKRPVARAQEVGHEEILNTQVQAALDAFRAAHLPQAARTPVTHRWAGIMDFSLDGEPYVGAVPGMPGVRAACGFTGHGFGYATRSAELLAAQVLGKREPVPAWLAPDRAVEPGLAPE
ncbi:MAG: FAD-binding oxidoreductase [Halobacteriales archaeon]|nr:FAD-binding oxidoreductase [Halobacteriales archaeon]